MSQIDPKQIHEDATYFLSKLNIGASFLDARAFQIMNNNLGIGDMLKEIEELRKQNELYQSLQDSDSFVFLDGMPDRPWTDTEVEIINRHNARFAGQLRNNDGKIEFVDRRGAALEIKPYDGPFCGTGAQFIMPAFPEESVSFNPEKLKKLVIEGKVDTFCPTCGKTLWEELPDKSCIKCGQEIDHQNSEFVTIDKLHEVIKQHENVSAETPN